jgi:hypothetical protein
MASGAMPALEAEGMDCFGRIVVGEKDSETVKKKSGAGEVVRRAEKTVFKAAARAAALKLFGMME